MVKHSSGKPLCLFFIAVWLLLAAGCVANRAYRDKDTRPWVKTPAPPFVSGDQLAQYEPFSASRPDHHYDLSFIEFDDQGDYWDRRQLAWTVQELKHAASAANVVLVIYVHGWQNDASDLRGHDVPKFKCLLDRLSSAQGNGRRFCGVYIGWRGKSVSGGDGVFPNGSVPDLLSKSFFFVPHELSLFDRQSAATRVAGTPITEAIFTTVRAARTAAQASGHLTKSILIGHSFGALVVEKAMAQALAAEVIVNDAASNGSAFDTPADFIVLLNSAAQSIYAKEMMDLLRRRHPGASAGGSPDEISARRPLIVSVTSTADDATGTLFPIGTSVSNATAVFRRYEWDERFGPSSHDVDQRQYLTTTPGHNPLLASHIAVPEGVPFLPVLDDDSGTCDRTTPLTAVGQNLQEPLTSREGNVRFVTVNPAGVSCYWTLQPTAPELQTPYWIVQVPKYIMRDHSDIFNENSLGLLARLFRLSNPNEEPGIAMTAKPRTMRLMDPTAADPTPAEKKQR